MNEIEYFIEGLDEGHTRDRFDWYVRTLDPFQFKVIIPLDKTEGWLDFYYKYHAKEGEVTPEFGDIKEWTHAEELTVVPKDKTINTRCKCVFKTAPRGSLVVVSGDERFGVQVYCGESTHSTKTVHMVKVMPMDEESEAPLAWHMPCDRLYMPHPTPWPFTQEFDDSMSKRYKASVSDLAYWGAEGEVASKLHANNLKEGDDGA